MEKQVYVVLGMPRSGTSAITRGLHALGIELGEKLQPAGKANPTGFWEDLDIMYKINRGITNLTSDVWMQDDAMTPGSASYPVLRKFHEHASRVVLDRLEGKQHWGVKDPRMIKYLPFWSSVLSSLSVSDRYVIAIRHPLARASSGQSFNQMDIEAGLIEWVKSMITIIDHTKGKKRVMVSYDQMLYNPMHQLERMHSQLDIPITPDPSAMEQYANKFIDKKLRHYSFSEDDLTAHPAAATVPLCAELYAFLMRIAKDEIRFDDAEFISDWEKIKKSYAEVQPLYDYVERILLRETQLSRQFRKFETSIPSKLVYPLRVIDDGLRRLRQQRRARKRLECT